MFPFFRFLLIVLAVMMPSVSLLSGVSPAFAQSSRAVRDVRYDPAGDPKLNSLDIFSPVGKTKCPVVVFIHGGGWQIGDKRGNPKGKSEAFPQHGYVFVSINYRLAPAVKHPVLVQDCAKAIAWVKSNIAKYGGDPNQLFVMGHSAGAHLAALVSTDEQYLKKEGLTLAALRGTILLDGGSYDMTPTGVKKADKDERIVDAFGKDPAVHKSASPLYNVSAGKAIPPFLILYVSYRNDTKAQSNALAAKLTQAGVKAEVRPAENKTHETINKELGNKGDIPTQRVYAFIDTLTTGKTVAMPEPTLKTEAKSTPPTLRQSLAVLNLTADQKDKAQELMTKYKGDRKNPELRKQFLALLTPEQREKAKNIMP